MTAGYVYILTNPSMQNQVKIGKTTRTPKDRATEIFSSTGVPTPFKVAYEELVSDCETVERRIHDKFKDYRVNPQREFFSVPVLDATKALQEIARDFKIEPQPDATPDFKVYRIEIGLWGNPPYPYDIKSKRKETVEFEGKLLAEAEERSNKVYTGYELYLLTNGHYAVYRISIYNLGDWTVAHLAGVNAWNEIDPPLTLSELQDRYPLVAQAAGLTRVRKFTPD